MTGWAFQVGSRSRFIELGFVLSGAMPRVPNVPPLVVASGAEHDDTRLDDGTSGCNELLVLGTHMGSHLDGLSHVSHEGRVHGGRPVADVQTRGGVNALDMTTVGPFLAPGFLFDLPSLYGRGVTDEALAVTPDELAPLRGLRLDGSVVLIRTGCGRLWREDPAGFSAPDRARPGLAADGAQWLAEQGVVAVGTDSFTIERWPSGGERAMPAHRTLLVEHGVHIFEALDLEELGAVAPQDFLFVALPLRIAGASGSPVRPIAVVSRRE